MEAVRNQSRGEITGWCIFASMNNTARGMGTALYIVARYQTNHSYEYNTRYLFSGETTIL